VLLLGLICVLSSVIMVSKVILVTCGESKKKREVEANTVGELRLELELATAHLQVRCINCSHVVYIMSIRTMIMRR